MYPKQLELDLFEQQSNDRPAIHIVNFSGGKDSTAMLLFMLENNYPIDYVVFCDLGAEFPEIYDNIDKVNNLLESSIGKSITILKPKYSIIDYMTIYKRSRGRFKGKPYCFPSPNNRWCSFKKTDLTRVFRSRFQNSYQIIEYIGYNSSEYNRFSRSKKLLWNKFGVLVESPLYTNNFQSNDCLQLCYSYGLTFEGLYEHLSRASCWCCPFKQLGEFKYLIENRPELWNQIREIENFHRNVCDGYWKFSYIKGNPVSCDEIEKLIYEGEGRL